MNAETNRDTNGVGQEFIITRKLDAPRELVWRTCTEARHLAQWWGPTGFSTPVCDWDARPGGRIFVVMRSPDGTDYPMGGEFKELLAPERMTFVTGVLDAKGDFIFQLLHTITLEECDNSTLLTEHARVIHATPEAAFYIAGFEPGKILSLGRLNDHLAQNTEPLIVERTLSAPVNLVWTALTTTEAIREWSFEVNAFEPEPGFEFGFSVSKEDHTYLHHCKVIDVIPEKRLAYTWRYDGYAGDSQVCFDLFAEGDKTRIRVTHTGLESFPSMPIFARSNFHRGWTQLVGTSLKEFLEQQCPIPQEPPSHSAN